MSEATTSMTTSIWQPRSAWTGFARGGRSGANQGEAGVKVSLRSASLASVIVAEGRQAELDRILTDRFGFPPPEPGRARFEGERGLVWSAPGQWLAVAGTGAELHGLADALEGVAAVTDQGDGRALARISGPRARALLAKGVAIDLHPRAFGPGSTAVTNIAHINVQLWQLDAATYDVTVARTFAGSFWSWLDHAAAEFGLETRLDG